MVYEAVLNEGQLIFVVMIRELKSIIKTISLHSQAQSLITVRLQFHLFISSTGLLTGKKENLGGSRSSAQQKTSLIRHIPDDEELAALTNILFSLISPEQCPSHDSLRQAYTPAHVP